MTHRLADTGFVSPHFYDALEPPQEALDTWLIHYNRERPHRGYRNLGRRALDSVTQYLSTVRQEAW